MAFNYGNGGRESFQKDRKGMRYGHRSAEKRYELAKTPGLITSLWPEKWRKTWGKIYKGHRSAEKRYDHQKILV